jgi:FixJ family two-component response regulator
VISRNTAFTYRNKPVDTKQIGRELGESDRPNGPTCLVLDIRLPGRSGLDFQRELAAADIQIPIIFITGHGDIPMSVQAMKGGAIEFLTKPFRDQDLIDAIQLGLARDRARRENEKALGTLRLDRNVCVPRAPPCHGARGKRALRRMGIVAK